MPLPTSTRPPFTTAPLVISTKLADPLASSVPELATAPLTKIVPPLKVSSKVPALIVPPLNVSAAPPKTFPVMPPLISPPVASMEVPEPNSTVAPESGIIWPRGTGAEGTQRSRRY